METTMRKIYWAAPALLATILMVFAFGCSDKSGSGGESTNQVGQVQIIATDTLKYVPGDSASTPVTVIVSSREGRVLPGRKVSVSLVNPSLGFLQYQNTTLQDTTNEFGRVEMLYTSVNRPGNNTILAICDGIQAEPWPLVIQENTTVISHLTLRLSRHLLQVPQGMEDTVTVAVSVVDFSGNGISNMQIALSSPDGGRLSALPVTDESGYASTIWYSNGYTGVAHVSARAGDLIVTDTVDVRTVGSLGSLVITADLPQVWANYCVTPDTIRATLKDQRNIAVVGDTIMFACVGGTVTGRAVTDSLGRAKVTFCDIGIPSETDSAEVLAIYPDFSLTDTAHIWVNPALNVGQVNLTLSNMSGIAGVDSTPVNVAVFYEDLSRVTGLTIRFEALCGYFTQPLDTLVNGSVQPTNYYHFCNTITEGDFQEKIWAVVGNNLATSDTLYPTVNPGQARQVFIFTWRSSINTNDTTAVIAMVFDSLNNHVRDGIPVIFSTTIGTVNPGSPEVAATDPDGVAHAVLSSGPSAGQAIVKASLGFGFQEDSTVIGIVSGEAANIQINVSNTSPQVYGTGGIEYTQLYGTVNDAHGNPVPDGQWVTFEVLWGLPGGGININNHGLVDSAQTASGTATATLNSGTIAGPVTIEARTTIFDADSNAIVLRARHNGVSIVAGPPASIEMYPTEIGIDGGGSTWELEISALVKDMWNNPVRDGTAVFFSVVPDTAQIVSDSAFTFNEDVNNDQRHGIAYTLMRYQSPATFYEVLITARTGGTNPPTEEIAFILPLIEPEIQLSLIPDHWDFSVPGQSDSRVECRSRVVDGHDVPINMAHVIYGSQRGTFKDAPTGGNTQNEAWTGPQGDPAGDDGVTSLWLRGPVGDFFIDDVSRETTCEVTVEVFGYSEATDQDLINYRREVGPN